MAMDQESPFARFWGQMIRWLANCTAEVKAEAGITARTDKAYYGPDSAITILPARSSPRHFDEMMSHLEAIKPDRATSLGATLHRLADRFKRRCLIILVSDLYDDPEAVEPALHHFHYKRHEVIVFHVLDHAEITFPFRDTASFVDMETGERLQVDPAYVRDEYRRQLDAFIDR